MQTAHRNEMAMKIIIQNDYSATEKSVEEKSLREHLRSNETITVYHILRDFLPSCKHVRVMKKYIVKVEFSRVYIFSYFGLKHRSWVLVRAASVRRVLTCTHDLCFEQK